MPIIPVYAVYVYAVYVSVYVYVYVYVNVYVNVYVYVCRWRGVYARKKTHSNSHSSISQAGLVQCSDGHLSAMGGQTDGPVSGTVLTQY